MDAEVQAGQQKKRDEATRVAPPYYALPGTDLDAIDVIQRLGLCYEVGAAFSYLWRAGKKPGESEERDLEKAIECLRRRVEWLKKEKV